MSESTGAARAFDDLVDESLDEAAFLWQRWETDLSSPTRNLGEVWSWTEDRLLGAIDGVRAAGSANPDAAVTGLQAEDKYRVIASTATLGLSEDAGVAEVLASAVGAADDEKLPLMLRALEVVGSGAALRAVAKSLRARGAMAELCRLKAFRRADVTDEVAAAMASKDAGVEAAALRAVAYAPGQDFDTLIAHHLTHSDPNVRLAAIESGMRRAMPDAWTAARKGADQRTAAAAPYLKWMALFGKADEHELVYMALRVPALQMPAVWALGHLGTERAVDTCLLGMAHEMTARACGEVYCWITGADLVRDGLEKREEPAEPPEFEDEDLDANLVPGPEGYWPVPDPDKIRAHWAARRQTFAPEVRHIHGAPASPDRVSAMIESGPMLRRPDLVFELGVRTRGKYDVETRALTARQRQMMAASRAAVAAAGGH
jgi:uncharacterized protein (TIGR02270 family)